ncbi:hypothetical protein JOF48_000821 [Arthrobacter stackebrandtii]|uniref:Uncharacterized protein n=1 Tax=Arthrobacter stackebrandtii TaxID=272161 RepID=A0ABS4YTA6_9MICC|nr:hypothetical protein [Arthrobacter stackebrandtii]
MCADCATAQSFRFTNIGSRHRLTMATRIKSDLVRSGSQHQTSGRLNLGAAYANFVNAVKSPDVVGGAVSYAAAHLWNCSPTIGELRLPQIQRRVKRVKHGSNKSSREQPCWIIIGMIDDHNQPEDDADAREPRAREGHLAFGDGNGKVAKVERSRCRFLSLVTHPERTKDNGLTSVRLVRVNQPTQMRGSLVWEQCATSHRSGRYQLHFAPWATNSETNQEQSWEFQRRTKSSLGHRKTMPPPS